MMNKYVAILAATLLIFCTMGLPSRADAILLGTDITVNDGMNSSGAWFGGTGNVDQRTAAGIRVAEDNEVERNCVTGQQWDLEGFYLKGTTLTMVGGYNFKSGEVDPYRGYRYYSGDLFIDIDGNANYPASVNTVNVRNDIITNTFGYDYVLDIDFSNNTYSVIKLDSYSMTQIVFFDENSGSNPWRYYGETQGHTTQYILQNQVLAFGNYTSSEVNNLNGTNHYAAQFDLSFLRDIEGFDGDFTTHFTMQCGNDDLLGKGNIAPVPEPATLLLLGSGLFGIAGFRRKKHQE